MLHRATIRHQTWWLAWPRVAKSLHSVARAQVEEAVRRLSLRIPPRSRRFARCPWSRRPGPAASRSPRPRRAARGSRAADPRSGIAVRDEGHAGDAGDAGAAPPSPGLAAARPPGPRGQGRRGGRHARRHRQRAHGRGRARRIRRHRERAREARRAARGDLRCASCHRTSQINLRAGAIRAHAGPDSLAGDRSNSRSWMLVLPR